MKKVVKLEEYLIKNPVIAAIKNDEDLEKVINSKIVIVFCIIWKHNEYKENMR